MKSLKETKVSKEEPKPTRVQRGRHFKDTKEKEKPKKKVNKITKKVSLHKNKKSSKKKLTKKQIIKRILLFIPLVLVTVLYFLSEGIKKLLKLIKKYWKYILVSVIVIAMTVSIILSHIHINRLNEQYNTYKQDTENVITELNSTIDNYKQELNTYKEEQNNNQEETKNRLEELDKKVTSRSMERQASSSSVSSSTSVTQPTSELQEYAHNLCINTYGWSESDFTCLVKLWNRESNWNPNAHNSSSGAHGIPQSLPASKMASEGADYYTNGETQIRWGLKYIAGRYGNPSNAWAHSQSTGWY